MNTSRNALIEPRRHQRQRDRCERPIARCAQRLRSLFERRADPVDDADEHEIRNRRERERLRKPDARQTVDPARRIDAERRTRAWR